MGLSETGVKLIAEGKEAFLNTLTSAEKAVEGFTHKSEIAGKQTSMLGDIFKGTFAADLFMGAIEKISSGIEEIGSRALESLDMMERLNVALTTMAAQEIVAAGGADTVSGAMAQAGPAAEILLAKLREISLTSPFSAQDITNTFRMQMAMGIASGSALDLTQAFMDIAAAKGEGADAMTGMAQALGLVAESGQITSRTLRSFRLEGIDLAVVFRTQLKMSIEEVNAALQSGKLTMADVSQAFVDYATVNFGGAAAQLAKTDEGIKTSFENLMAFSSIDVLGPPMEKVTAALSNLFIVAQNFANSGALKDIGTIFADVVGLFIADAPEMPKATGDSLIEIRTQFEDAAVSAVTWGANLVTSFAEGMIMGIGAVLSALNYIAGIISSWLKPGSPPKILPDIDKWGSMTMGEYLKGFTEADYSALSGIQNPMKQIFSMFKVDNSVYQGISKQIAEALASGTGGSAAMFDAIRNSAGAFGDDLVELTKRELALAAATDAVKSKEEALDAAKKREMAAYGVVDKELAKYNQMLRGGYSEKELKAQRALINAKYASAKATTKDVAQKQTDLDAAKANIDVLKQQVQLQSDLLQQLIQLQEQKGKTAGAGGGAGLGGEIPLPKITMPDMTGADTNLQKSLTDLGDNFKLKIGAIFDQMKKDITAQWQASKVSESWTSITQTFSGIAALFPPGFLETIAKLGGIFLGVAAGVGVLNLAFSAITSPLGLFVLAIGGLILVLSDPRIQGGLIAWGNGFALLGAAIKVKFVQMLQDAAKGIGAWATGLQQLWTALGKWLSDKWDAITKGLGAFFSGLGLLLTAVGTAIDAWINDPKTGVLAKLKGFVDSFITAGEDLIKGLITGIANKSQEVIDALVNLAKQAIQELWKELGITHSPSELTKIAGADVVKGLTIGVDKHAPDAIASMSKLAFAIPQIQQVAQSMPAQYINSSYANNINVNMGGQNINNGMDAAMVYSLARQAVVDALARG